MFINKIKIFKRYLIVSFINYINNYINKNFILLQKIIGKGVDTVASLDECAILGLRGDLCNCDCDNFGVVGVVVNGKFFLNGLAGVRTGLDFILDLLAFVNTCSGNKELRNSFLSSKCSLN